ncbi:hypothetical protein [Longimicrobium sp.]|uniref:hypothetical protein n=1 Tax=Longimicrobium sp. TaxID=2029185 RepID=UPI002E2FBA82|nr:hypothetical protein [Longimicrobium sp.]HEX6038203.1 hypothetical protein [Longimicrobium sp.]
MTRKTLAAAFVLALPLSSLLVACGGGGDTDRAALEREALERDLDLALQPDSTREVALRDVALVDSSAGTVAPAPGQPRAPAPAPAAAKPQAAAPSRPAEPAGPRYVTRTASSGTSMTVRFTESLSTRYASEGSTFSTTLTHALTDDQGRTVVPAGATVRGRVTRSVASGGGLGRDAGISVTLTSISYNGERYPIDVTMVDAPAVRKQSRQSRGQTAATVAGGAAVGAIAGRVLGRSRRSTAIGAVAGAGAGTAVVVASHDIDAVIPAGSTATVRLDGPVSVRRRAD